MALSHSPTSRCTSVFWSVDERIDSDLLLAEVGAFQDFAFHPMLVPCVMFAATLEIGIKRRHSIKQKLRVLESGTHRLIQQGAQSSINDHRGYGRLHEASASIETLFELLGSCRREQASREGRYHFWSSYHDVLVEGFKYAEQALTYVPPDLFIKAHLGLQQWTAITWRKFESLKARDVDHVARVDNVSDMV